VILLAHLTRGPFANTTPSETAELDQRRLSGAELLRFDCSDTYDAVRGTEIVELQPARVYPRALEVQASEEGDRGGRPPLPTSSFVNSSPMKSPSLLSLVISFAAG
jgi:hypothetical protein